MSLKFYEDLSWFGKLLYRLHLKRAITFSKEDYHQLVSATKFLENCPRKDFFKFSEEVDRRWEQ